MGLQLGDMLPMGFYPGRPATSISEQLYIIVNFLTGPVVQYSTKSKRSPLEGESQTVQSRSHPERQTCNNMSLVYIHSLSFHQVCPLMCAQKSLLSTSSPFTYICIHQYQFICQVSAAFSSQLTVVSVN